MVCGNPSFKACVPPTLDLWNRGIKPLFSGQKPIECHLKEENWVDVVNGTFHITEQASRDHGNISCQYTPLKRASDDQTVLDMETVNITHGDPITSDFFTASCVSDLSNKIYEDVHSGIYKKTIEARPLPTDAMGFNVLILGLDSVSRMAWQRLFPETYNYFKDTLGGIVFEGYNAVGDGTINNLLPFLCGKFQKELPEARRGKPNATRVDGYPWVWKNYEQLGYVTQYIEDRADINTFNMRMLGFKEQPVHHYMRPFFLRRRAKGKTFDLCLGSKRLHVNVFNWVQDFFAAYKNHPKFSFTILNSLTHDTFKFAADADKDLLAFLQYMESQGNMKNTLYILMADHGPRFHGIRFMAQGRLEERLPFMGIWVPPKFKTKYPIHLKNLRINSHRLTTPFDIYETLMDVVNFREARVGNISQRGISLFREIPPKRTCLQAGVDVHWCACQNLKSLPVNDSVVQNASIKLVDKINSLTSNFSKLCHRLSLNQTIKASIYTQGQSGIVANESEVYYSIRVMTTPGKALFQATMKYNTLSGNFTVLEQHISRINAFLKQSRCIQRLDPSLLIFCYCSVG